MANINEFPQSLVPGLLRSAWNTSGACTGVVNFDFAKFDMTKLRVAIIYFWLIERRGGEKVLEVLCEMFPQADIFTHAINKKIFASLVRRHKVTTTFIQKLPWTQNTLKFYVPFMPFASEQFELSNYDLIISNESGPAKGVLRSEDSVHICYCHSPMRYIWNKHAEYIRWSGPFSRMAMRLSSHYLRVIDYVSAARVDQFVANSTAVAKRISKYYRRPSRIIFPPIDTSFFSASDDQGYYLYCGKLTAYKRPDLAVDCFNNLGLPLRVIGDGEMRRKLKSRAKPNIQFLGRVDDTELRQNMAHCRALVFPGEEDFGIVPVEAMASGRPVIAYARGGALDTVVEGLTGTFFEEPSVDSLIDAVRRFEAARDTFDPEAIVRHAEKFDTRHFRDQMTRLIRELLEGESCGHGLTKTTRR